MRARGGGRRGTRSGAARRAQRPAAVAIRGEPERLQKMLARSGLASRREVEAWIRAGRLTINGVVAALGARVQVGDDVRLDGRTVRARAALGQARVFIGHRSPGEPLAASPAAAAGGAPRTAWLARLPHRAGRRFIAVSPMPRVDGGLELVTADGELAARLQRSVHALESVFGVRVRGELSDSQLLAVVVGELDSGVHLAVERCTAAGGEGANRWYTLAVHGASGKQVRQLFERQGARVSRVLRTQLGPVALERSLGRGRFREITQAELRALLAAEASGVADG